MYRSRPINHSVTPRNSFAFEWETAEKLRSFVHVPIDIFSTEVPSLHQTLLHTGSYILPKSNPPRSRYGDVLEAAIFHVQGSYVYKHLCDFITTQHRLDL